MATRNNPRLIISIHLFGDLHEHVVDKGAAVASCFHALAPGNVEMIGKPARVDGLFPVLKLKAFNFSSESEAV